MPFRIAPFAGQTYPGPYANHHDIRAYLGFGEVVRRTFGDGQDYFTVASRKLPADFCESGVWVPLLTSTEHPSGGSCLLWCKPGNPSSTGRRGKSSAHRCFVQCPTCAATVPAGRTMQHKCKS